MDSQTKILYIAGFGRNGGTLLDRILGQIPGFFSLGELRFVWNKGVLRNELCSCGVPFKECSFWSRVFNRAFGGFDEELATYAYSLFRSTNRTRHIPLQVSPWKPHRFLNRYQEYVAILHKLFKAIEEESSCSVLVDSSKFASYGLALSQLPDMSLYVVHLVRDSRGVAFSWRKKVLKPEVKSSLTYMKRYPIWQSTLRWVYLNTFAELLRAYSKKYLLVRYEDFVRNPQRILCDIMHMLNVSCDNLPFVGERTVKLEKTHTQSGNPSRFQHGEIQIYYDDAWVRRMGIGARLLSTALSWPLLLRHRYPILDFTHIFGATGQKRDFMLL